jgi:hypothetical protein
VAQQRHLLAFQQAGYEAEAFIHRFTLVPGQLGALPETPKYVNHVLGIICKLSVDKLTAAGAGTKRTVCDNLDHLQTIACSELLLLGFELIRDLSAGRMRRSSPGYRARASFAASPRQRSSLPSPWFSPPHTVSSSRSEPVRLMSAALN